MALSDLTPEQLVKETLEIKKRVAVLLVIACYVEEHFEELWDEYGGSWGELTKVQKNALIAALAKKAGVVGIDAEAIIFLRSMIDVWLGTHANAVTLAKLKDRMDLLNMQLIDVQSKITALTAG